MSLANPFTSSPPAVRKPAFEVDFGASSDDWSQALLEIDLELGLLPHVDVLRLRWAAGAANAPNVSAGDTGQLKLGYTDDKKAVFQGQVSQVQPQLNGQLGLEAVNGGAALAALRLNQAYEQQNAGDVVADLAGQAGVATGSVSAGSKLAYLAVDDGRSALTHIGDLALRCGFPAFFDGDGTLVFAEVAATPAVATFTYGVDILAMQVDERGDLAGGYTVFGEGAAGAEGDDAWCWLIKDPSAVKGEAGEKPARLISDRALRNAGAASDAAAGLLQAARFKHQSAQLRVPGTAAALPGAIIAVTEAPADAMNGDWLVTGARHQLARGRGFTSRLTLTRSGAGAAGLLGGLL